MPHTKTEKTFLIIIRLCLALLFLFAALAQPNLLPEERDGLILLAVIVIPIFIWILYSDGRKILGLLKNTSRSFKQASRVDVTPSLLLDSGAAREVVEKIDLSKPDPRPLRDRIATWIGMTLLVLIGVSLLGVLFYMALFSHT